MSEPVIVPAQTTTAILPQEKGGGAVPAAAPLPPPATGLDRLLMASSEASPGPFVRQLQSLLETPSPAPAPGQPGLENGKAWEASHSVLAVHFEGESVLSEPEMNQRESDPRSVELLIPDSAVNERGRPPLILAEVGQALAEPQGKKATTESEAAPPTRPVRGAPALHQPEDSGPHEPTPLEVPPLEQAFLRDEVAEEDGREGLLDVALQLPLPPPAVDVPPAPPGQALPEVVGDTEDDRPAPTPARGQGAALNRDPDSGLEAPSKSEAPAMVAVSPSTVAPPALLATSSPESLSRDATPVEVGGTTPEVLPAAARQAKPLPIPVKPGDPPGQRVAELGVEQSPPAPVVAAARPRVPSKDAPPAEDVGRKPAVPSSPSLAAQGAPAVPLQRPLAVTLSRPTREPAARFGADPDCREPEGKVISVPAEPEQGSPSPHRPLEPSLPALEAQAEVAPRAATPQASRVRVVEAHPGPAAPVAAEPEAAAVATGKELARVARADDQASPAPGPAPAPDADAEPMPEAEVVAGGARLESPPSRAVRPMPERPSPVDLEEPKTATVLPRLLGCLDIQAAAEVVVPDVPVALPLRLERQGAEVLVPQTLWIRQVEREIARVFQVERLAVAEPATQPNGLTAVHSTPPALLVGESREQTATRTQPEARLTSTASQPSADSAMESTFVSAARSPGLEPAAAKAAPQPWLALADAPEGEPALPSAGKAGLEAAAEPPGGERLLETSTTPPTAAPLEVPLEEETMPEGREASGEALVPETGQTRPKNSSPPAPREMEPAPAPADPRLLDGQEQRMIRRYQMRHALQSEKHLDLHFHSERLGEVAASLDIQKSGHWTASLQLGEPAAEPGIVRQLERIQEHPLSEGHQLTGFSTGLMHSGQGQGERSKQRTLSPTKSSRTPKFSEELPIDSLGGQELRPRSGINLRA